MTHHSHVPVTLLGQCRFSVDNRERFALLLTPQYSYTFPTVPLTALVFKLVESSSLQPPGIPASILPPLLPEIPEAAVAISPLVNSMACRQETEKDHSNKWVESSRNEELRKCSTRQGTRGTNKQNMGPSPPDTVCGVARKSCLDQKVTREGSVPPCYL